jgi:phosphatidylglycerophosphate synthase
MRTMEQRSLRTRAQHGIYKVIDPFVKLLIKLGLTPNAVTTIGFLLNLGVAIVFVIGAEHSERVDLSYVGWAGALILFAGLFDMLDGQVARLGNMSSSFGALYDSVLDRYSELVMFLGICYYLVAHHYFLSSIFAFIALIGSMMVSYTRARAEGLGIKCSDGLMQRPERIITIGVSAMACGITSHYIGGDHKWYVPGVSFHILETMSIFTIPIALMAVLNNITAIKRLLGAKKTLDERDGITPTSSGKLVVAFGLIVLTGLLMGLAHKSLASKGKFPLSDKLVMDPQDTFPIPPGNANHLFYLQRTANTNTIICELNYNNKGVLDPEDPVHVYWIRYTEGGLKKELNYIQRTFAYGIKSESQGGGNYVLRFVSYKKLPLTLMRSPKDNKYHVFATINQRQAQLNRIFVKVEGGTFWSPNVVYMEMKGIDPITGKEVMERIKPV